MSDTPYVSFGSRIDPKRLFYSDEQIALKKMVSIVPGYGLLEPGTILAKITESTTRLERYVPYAVQAPTAGLAFIGGAYMLEDGANPSTTIKVTIEDSYKFAVGDHIGGVDSDGSPIDLGAISAIDRTTYSHYAILTIASADTSGLTVAKGAMVFIQTQTTTPYTNAVAILMEGVDTGRGEDAKGAQAAALFRNAMIYNGLLPNYDSGALTDLNGVIDGQHLIL